jgi:hypothetical protein
LDIRRKWRIPYIVGVEKHVKRKNSAGTVAEDGQVRRRSLLTRGGVVLAGVVGATAGGAALSSGRANAATGSSLVQGAVNSGGTNVAATVIDVANSTSATPSVIIGNSGSTGANEASPALRLTPAGSGLVIPSESTVGGDLVATNDGELWFTHEIESTPVPAIVHTDANSTSFAPLSAPHRILDTRYASLRGAILDGSGKLDSSGRLLAGKTIHINLTTLVSLADAMVANLTVTGPATGGHITLYPGGTLPNSSSINFLENWTLANMTVSGVDEYSSSISDSIAIYTTATTHVILDIAGFYVANFGQINSSVAAVSASGSRAQRISKAVQAGR